MNTEEKKAFLLLKSIIFQYHGLDENEQQLLENTARELDAEEELRWVYDFLEKEYLDAYDRARDYLNKVSIAKDQKIDFLHRVWKANSEKGHITEMEAIAILRLAKDWQVEAELIGKVRGG